MYVTPLCIIIKGEILFGCAVGQGLRHWVIDAELQVTSYDAMVDEVAV
jgi:hypothetical protein